MYWLHSNLFQAICYQGGKSTNYFTEDEADLAQLIKEFQMCGFPLTISRVRQLVYQYPHINGLDGSSEDLQMAGKKWIRGFLIRHPNITIKKAKKLSVAHAMGANPVVIADWFKKFKLITKAVGVNTPQEVWSGDETGSEQYQKKEGFLQSNPKW